MHFTYKTQGTCSSAIDFDVENNVLTNVVFTGGCNGNLKGISKLLKGMKAEDAIERMEGTTCGPRPTSCPDQIAKNLRKALAELG